MAKALNTGLALGLALAAAPARAVDIVIDWDKRFQQIEGIGAHLYLYDGGNLDYYNSPQFLKDFVDDQGNSMVRHEISPSFCSKEVALDKMEDYANYTQFDTGGSEVKLLRALQKLKAKDPSVKIIGTVWSPPGWMKTNNSATGGGSMKPDDYPHLARYLYQYVRYLKDKFGLDLYALSIQNELEFSESYNSCLYNPQQYHDALKAVGDYFKSKGPVPVFYGPEDMTGFTDKLVNYVGAIKGDPAVSPYLPVVATHGYADGVASDGGSADQNMTLYNSFKPYGVRFWMTETSGEHYRWPDGVAFDEFGTPLKGALVGLGTKMHIAFTYGFCSAWTYWAYGGPGTYSFGPQPEDKKYRVHEHYSKFIRPGAYRVEASPDGQDSVNVSAYYDEANKRLTAVLLNTSSQDRPVKLQVKYGLAVPSFQVFRTSASENFAKLADLAVKADDRTVSFTLPARSMATLAGGATPGAQGTPSPAPTITLNAPATSATTAIPVTLTVNRNFGYWSLDGANFNQFDLSYDAGVAHVLVRQSGTLTYYGSDGTSSTPKYTQAFTITRPANPTYSEGDDGLVKVEAENPTKVTAGAGEGARFEWKEMDGPLYTRVMQALPKSGPDTAIFDIGDGQGPALQYQINFTKAGKHSLWIRGTGPSNANGWYHSTIDYDLDGKDRGFAKFRLDLGGGVDSLKLMYGYMQWQRAEINVPAAGPHTLTFAMRADKFQFDQFEIAADTGYRPASFIRPPAAPTGLKVVSTGINDIKVAFNPTPRAMGYKLYYRTPGGTWNFWQSVNLDTTRTAYDFDHIGEDPLHADTTFEMHVAAIGAQDDSHGWDPGTTVPTVTATTKSGAGGGHLDGFQPARFGGYPIPGDGHFYRDGYRWEFKAICGDVSTMGSTIDQYRVAAVFFDSAGYIRSQPIPGGMGNLSFRISKMFYPTGAQFAIRVNGKEVARAHRLDHSTGAFFDYGFPGVNVTGPVAVEIKSLIPDSTNGSRGIISDVFWTPYAGGAPEAPKAQATADDAGSTVKVAWNAVAGAKGYHVWRNAYYKEYKVLVGTVDASKTTWVDSLPNPDTLTYQVSAFNDQGESPRGEGSVVIPQQGLKAAFYAANDLTGAPVERVDSVPIFNWGGNAPANGVAADHFSARWQGSIQFGIRPDQDKWLDTMKFTVHAQGGARLWVNGKLLIDRWNPAQADWEASDTMVLAYQGRYPIKLEYRKVGANAVAELRWDVPANRFQGWHHGIWFFPGARAVQPVVRLALPSPERPIARASVTARAGGVWVEVPEGQAFTLEVFDLRGARLAQLHRLRGGAFLMPVRGRGLAVARLRTASTALVAKVPLAP